MEYHTDMPDEHLPAVDVDIASNDVDFIIRWLLICCCFNTSFSQCWNKFLEAMRHILIFCSRMASKKLIISFDAVPLATLVAELIHLLATGVAALKPHLLT